MVPRTPPAPPGPTRPAGLGRKDPTRPAGLVGSLALAIQFSK